MLTLTGLDERTDLGRIDALSGAYPFLEWGVLYSPKAHAEGAPRYPGRAFIEDVLDRLGSRKLAVHFCGSSVRDLLADDNGAQELAARFGRVQVNMVAERHDLGALRALLERNPGTTFITQRNAANEILLDVLRGLPNHAILFDASAGRGIAPTEWPAAINGVDCGYAGGLSPTSLPAQLLRIEAASGSRAKWADLETGVRDRNDRLDLEACGVALKAFATHLADASVA